MKRLDQGRPWEPIQIQFDSLTEILVMEQAVAQRRQRLIDLLDGNKAVHHDADTEYRKLLNDQLKPLNDFWSLICPIE